LAITNPIRPPNSGLTPEAAQALAGNSQIPETGLPDPDLLEGLGDSIEAEPSLPQFDETGDYIDEPRLRQRAQPTPDARDKPKAGPPTLDEWMDFFSRIFLRVICDWYISFAFRGVDENVLSDREVDRLQLSEEERKRISVPLAELSNKSKIARRYGRTIVASGGAFDALIAFGMWTSRVNRIARKYKPAQPVRGRVINRERFGPDAQQAEGDGTAGANGGRVAGEWTIINPGG
jgi:hypothetical protein